MSFLAGIGVFGVAAALTIALWFGTKEGEGGKVTLSWGWCLALSLLAGAAFQAAGFPFNIVSSLIHDGLGLIGAAVPELTMPALALVLLLIALFKRLSRRGVSMLALVGFYVASGAGGQWGVVAERIQSTVQGIG